MQAKGRKAEMGVKLGELRKDIEALGSISEEQVAAEEAAVSVLLEVRHICQQLLLSSLNCKSLKP